MTSSNLSDDAKLCSFLQEFSIHVQKRALRLSNAVEKLEQKIEETNSNVDSALLEFMTTSDVQVVQYDISDSSCGDEVTRYNSHSKKIRPFLPAKEQAQETEQSMRAEEKEAIKDGIEALKYFHDSSEYTADHFFGLDEQAGDEEDGTESPCYYESSPADIFNQRPLPFIIGSREFIQSNDGGIGSG